MCRKTWAGWWVGEWKIHQSLPTLLRELWLPCRTRLRPKVELCLLKMQNFGVGDSWPRILYFRRHHGEEHHSHRQFTYGYKPRASEAYPQRLILVLEWGDSIHKQDLKWQDMCLDSAFYLPTGGSRKPMDPEQSQSYTFLTLSSSFLFISSLLYLSVHGSQIEPWEPHPPVCMLPPQVLEVPDSVPALPLVAEIQTPILCNTQAFRTALSWSNYTQRALNAQEIKNTAMKIITWCVMASWTCHK